MQKVKVNISEMHLLITELIIAIVFASWWTNTMYPSRENLSSGVPTESNQSSQLQRLARLLKLCIYLIKLLYFTIRNNKDADAQADAFVVSIRQSRGFSRRGPYQPVSFVILPSFSRVFLCLTSHQQLKSCGKRVMA